MIFVCPGNRTGAETEMRWRLTQSGTDTSEVYSGSSPRDTRSSEPAAERTGLGLVLSLPLCISTQDFAPAMIDEVERPAHIRQRFIVRY